MAATKVSKRRSQMSRDKTDDSRKRTVVYFVEGVSTLEDAEVANDGTESIPSIGAAFSGDATMTVSDINTESIDEDTNQWEVSVTWSYERDETDPDRYSDGDEFWTFTGRLESLQVHSAFVQTEVGDIARDVGKLVNVKDDGVVEGAPWDIPIGQLVVRYYKTASNVNNTFVQSVFGEYGKVNSSPYYGFAAGSLRFVNFRIPKEGDVLSELQFTFEIRPNEPLASLPSYTDPTGATINYPGDLQGWDYAWIDEVLSDNTTDLVPRVRGLYIAELYRDSTFSALGLSGSL